MTAEKLIYDAQKLIAEATGTTATPYQYIGGYGYFNEPNVGLEQVGWRWYGMTQGTFLSVDPLREGKNWYRYAELMPALQINATGLFIIDPLPPVPLFPKPHRPSQPPYCLPPSEAACSLYPRCSLMHFVCMHGGNDPWANCVRGCLRGRGKSYYDHQDHVDCWFRVCGYLVSLPEPVEI